MATLFGILQFHDLQFMEAPRFQRFGHDEFDRSRAGRFAVFRAEKAELTYTVGGERNAKPARELLFFVGARMRPNIPEWVQHAQAWSPIVTGLASIVVASLVAYIAWRQAKTAHDKLAFDLFDRRANVLAKVEEAIRLVMGPGRPVDQEPFRLLHEARAEARFLFERDVEEFIHNLIKATATLGLAQSKMEAGNDDDQDWPQVSHDALLEVHDGFENLANMMAPYMQFKHKVASH